MAPVVAMILVTPFLIARLSLQGYGLVALVGSFALALTTFDGGIGASAFRFFTAYRILDDRESTRRLFHTVVVALAVVASLALTIAWVIAPGGAALLHAPADVQRKAIPLIRLIPVVAFLAMVANLTRAVLRAHEQWSRTAMSATAGALVYLASAGALVLADTGPAGVVLALGLQQGTTALLNYVAIRHTLKGTQGLWVGWATARSYLSYAWRLQVATVSAFVMVELDVLIVGAFLPLREVALYNIASNVALQLQAVPMFLSSPFSRAVTSIFTRSGEVAATDYAERFQSLWVPLTSLFFAVASSAVWFVVFGWLGGASSVAGAIAAVLLVGYMVNVWTLPMSAVALAVGRPGVEARYGATAAFVNVALTVPATMVLGIWGVAVGTVLGQVAGSSYLIRLYRLSVGRQPTSFLRVVPYGHVLAAAFAVFFAGGLATMFDVGRPTLLLVVVSASALTLFVGSVGLRHARSGLITPDLDLLARPLPERAIA